MQFLGIEHPYRFISGKASRSSSETEMIRGKITKSPIYIEGQKYMETPEN